MNADQNFTVALERHFCFYLPLKKTTMTLVSGNEYVKIIWSGSCVIIITN